MQISNLMSLPIIPSSFIPINSTKFSHKAEPQNHSVSPKYLHLPTLHIQTSKPVWISILTSSMIVWITVLSFPPKKNLFYFLKRVLVHSPTPELPTSEIQMGYRHTKILFPSTQMAARKVLGQLASLGQWPLTTSNLLHLPSIPHWNIILGEW